MRKLILALSLMTPSILLGAQNGEKFTHLLDVDLSKDYDQDLGDILKKFGNASIKRIGDAATSETSACYFSSDKKVIVEFTRYEIGSGFTVRIPTEGDRVNCAMINRKDVTAGQLEVNGLKLGMSRSDFQNLLGKPTESKDNSLRYDFNRDENENGKDYFVLISIYARFVNSKLVQLSVSKTVST